MKQYLALINPPTMRARCTVSAMAAVAEFFIFLSWSNSYPGPDTDLLLYLGITALTIGFTYGTFGLSSAHRWRERLATLGLLGLHFGSLVFLFALALQRKFLLLSIISIH
jgi:hypothetical protein